MKATTALLKSCGAVVIGSGRSGNGNTRYRLPNGKVFVRAHEAGAGHSRGAMNEYRTLVRLVQDAAEAATKR